MKKSDKISLSDNEISEINNLIKILENKIKDLEWAYIRRDPENFNLLKRDILQMQRKIDSIIE